jgi:cytochrome P450
MAAVVTLNAVPGMSGELGSKGRDELRNLPPDVRLVLDPMGTWYVVRRADVDSLLHDRRLQGIGMTLFDLQGINDGPLRHWYEGIMFTNEGAAHHRLRTLVQKAFTPRAIERLRPFSAGEAARLLEPVRQARRGDLVDLAFYLPIRAMAALLGVPADDIDRFTASSVDLARVFGYMTPEQVTAATDAVVHLQGYVAALLEERRRTPGDDLITALLASEDEGDRLTHEETISMVVNLLVGGHDTTTSQIACSLLALLAHPGAMDQLAADRALVAAAVEESIRLLPGIGVVPRVTTTAIEVDGHKIPPGSLLMLMSSLANTDPEGFEQPDDFVLGRYDTSAAAGEQSLVPPARVLSFGAGAHYCLGAAMARMLVQEAVTAVAALPPPVALTESPDDLPWTRVLGEYPARLPITCG